MEIKKSYRNNRHIEKFNLQFTSTNQKSKHTKSQLDPSNTNMHHPIQKKYLVFDPLTIGGLTRVLSRSLS